MSVLIRDMEMPTEGEWILVNIFPDGKCVVQSWCGKDFICAEKLTAVPVPPYLDYSKPRKPMTNYDLLISKTPEELAKTIVGWLADAAELCGENRQEFDFTNAEEYAVSWLKSPMEE